MLNKQLIFTDLDLDTKEKVFETVIQKAIDLNLVSDLQPVLKGLFERESLLSTAVGNGIAMPHCKSQSVNQPFIAFVRLKEAMLWDEEEVTLVIFIIIPEHVDSNVHLKTLAKISKKLIHQSFIDQLNTENKETIYTYLKEALEG
ncbi:MAG TPA: fructose PTS transporter subunit IIA [Erysipelothrix sp.]|nr:fructose PTS transporter subunit IIA [Erysipelothrix sp.]